MDKLRLGYAYHGNKMLNHVEEDLRDMAAHGCNIVVHMLSHNDWNRHKRVVREMVRMTEELGMEAWIDNWGLGGPPGEVSHFLAYHPEAHVCYSDGSIDPIRVCLNSSAFRAFSKEWIDAVEYVGGKKIFWDEPHLPNKKTDTGVVYSCACDNCRALFSKKYGYEMPREINADVEEFRLESIVDYFREVTEYSASKNIENAVCVMLGTSGISLETADKICSLDTVEDIGSDPYWLGVKGADAYEYAYLGAKRNVEMCEKFGKKHNLWLQTYNNPMGSEEDIVMAAEALYDAGARTILAWGYYGSVSNDYGAKNPIVVKAKTEEAFLRLRNRERECILEEKRRAMSEKRGK